MRLQSEVKEWFDGSAMLPPDGRVHFIGIGGAGMSALARILLHQGRQVSGSDVQDSAVLNDLRARGAEIALGHSAINVRGASAVVISDAIDLNVNPEALAARNDGIVLLRRSQLLGQILLGRRLIAVTGTHGKSTTTALLTQILAAVGHDPIGVIGADVPALGGNVRLGCGEFAVAEACEAYDSFLDLRPYTVLLTNLEPDHLDYHDNWQNLQRSVERFVRSAAGDPKLIYCADDPGASGLAAAVGGGFSYGFGKADYSGKYENGELVTDAGSVNLRIPGRHNALNALGALAVAQVVGAEPLQALRALAEASGCKRRLEQIGERNGVLIYDDYAHHPTEIEASSAALREAHPGRRLLVVFQPHLYTRTRDHLEGFVTALLRPDVVFVTDIYPAREKPIPGISAALIVEGLEARHRDVHYVPSRHFLPRDVALIATSGDVVVGMGAGNIESFAPDFLDELGRAEGSLRVAVFLGGESVEREVSLISGGMVAEALKRRGYQVTAYDPAELLLNSADLSQLVGPRRPDIVFLALHGTGAEDGTIQGLLDLLHLPYTGSGVAASALAMDKRATKRLLEQHGIPVPSDNLVPRGGQIPPVKCPVVVKPNAQGSTIGLTVVADAKDLQRAVRRALKYDRFALIEELIEGVEISIPVLGESALPAVEIRPKSGMYDFAAKYTPGETEEIVPAGISEAAAKIAEEYALKVHRLVGAQDFSRTDMVVCDDRVVVLEINTLPGLTPTSLLPRSAESAGISFDDLCDRILHSALKRYDIAER